jgi:hypothetical protein
MTKSAQSQIEKRLTALETAVARLDSQQRRPWWSEVAGAFVNDPAFVRAMKLGRAYRDSTSSTPSAHRHVHP